MYTSCIERFEQMVEHDPTHVAIELDGEVVFTYQQLRDQARRIGMSLREQGIGKEDIVALYFEKSPEYLLALLSVWYAGAAFLPLPPSTPKERLDFILHNASPKAVLCDQHQLLDEDKARSIFSLQHLLLDASSYIPIDTVAEDLAYVIYTSGSTGTPKGVLVNHSGIVNILEQQIELFELTPNSRSLFVLSITFDASLSDIGTALLSGATLCMESMSRTELASTMMDVIEKRQITFVDMPPSLLAVHDPQTKPPSLACIVIGGESTGVEVIRSWAQVCRVINVYGPTETTICSSMMVCDPKTWNGQNIGFPIAGLDYVVVDGELWIGGIGVARGYQKLDQLTAEKFVTHKGQRFFRTGDAVEKRQDGFYFLGRIDRQLKIRGQLVAPEELEFVLMEYPGIDRVAVVPLLDAQDRPRGLKAFLQTNKEIDQQTLNTFLQTKLSSWMIPSDIDFVKQLPENLHAKIEFRQLNEQAKQSIVGDSTDRLQTLVQLWEDILGKNNIGIDQDFYELGGDSLATIEFLVRAKNKGIDITVELVAQQRTIRKIDAALSASQQKDDGRSAELLQKDAELDTDMQTWIQQASSIPVASSNILLVTGANGFLGVRVVRELLMRTQNDLVLLMRRKTSEAAKRDFQDMVSAQHMEFDEQWFKRLRFVTGDVSKKQLGLSRTVWKELTESVGSIYHCAAMVNMTATYEQMKSVNVGGMREMIRFALTGSRKKLNDCSTLSVFVATNQFTGTVYEQDSLNATEVVYGGYAQTKWVAERLLRAVPESVLERNIFRFGLITGDSTTGVCSPHDYLRMFVEGLCSLGKIPEGNVADLEVDSTPVDYAAAAYVHLGQTQSNRTFHIANTRGFTLQMILDELQARCGIQTVSVDEWKAWISKKQMSVKESATLMALCRLLPDVHAFDLYRSMDLFQATNITFDQQQTQAGLKGTSIVLPKADAALLHRYMNYFFAHD